MFELNRVVSREDGFAVEEAISYLVANYNDSGDNPKPVILHSLRVALTLMEMGYEREVVVGAVLHDVLEDTRVGPEKLKQDFGEDIFRLVDAVSFDKSITNPVEQYKEMYERVLVYGRDAVVIKAVDMAINSLYVHLASDTNKRGQLVEKVVYFLDLTKDFSHEPAWKLLKARSLEMTTGD